MLNPAFEREEKESKGGTLENPSVADPIFSDIPAVFGGQSRGTTEE